MAVAYQIACLIASTTSLLTSPGALGESLDAEVRQAMKTPGSVKVCGCDLHAVVSNTVTVARLHILQPKPKHSIYTPE